MKFVDEVEIYAHSGRGGPGAKSFRREKFAPRGGPDGGDGGRGGDLIFVVREGMSSLLDLRYKRRYLAEDGEAGKGENRNGSNGQDLIVPVPPGTRIFNSHGELLCDLGVDTPEFLCFKGGRGGKGNAFFKTSVNQAPEHFQPGEGGEGDHLKLELKLLADVGIIGYPNAGKSTLISRISQAHPKVADYPFTTLVPNLGVVSLGEGHNLVVADIPGLIPGAHEGSGLGTKFLKHIERTKGFVHLIDVSDFSGRDPMQDFDDINLELSLYDDLHQEEPFYESLSTRPQVVVLNKIDAADPLKVEEYVRKFKKKGRMVKTLSAVCGHGIQDLIYEMGNIFREEKAKDQSEMANERNSFRQ